MTATDNARRAYEAAQRMQFRGEGNLGHAMDAKILFTNTTTTYEAALIADAQAKLDAVGVVIGETMCCVGPNDVHPFKITHLVAKPDAGIVMAYWDDNLAYEVGMIRPYVAPVVKEMVLHNGEVSDWTPYPYGKDKFRLTLSNVTPADLDAMKPGDVIEGSYKIERMK